MIELLIFCAVLVLIVAAYGYFVPPLLGRMRWAIPVVDMVLLALIITLTAFALIKLGWLTWHLTF